MSLLQSRSCWEGYYPEVPTTQVAHSVNKQSLRIYYLQDSELGISEGHRRKGAWAATQLLKVQDCQSLRANAWATVLQAKVIHVQEAQEAWKRGSLGSEWKAWGRQGEQGFGEQGFSEEKQASQGCHV